MKLLSKQQNTQDYLTGTIIKNLLGGPNQSL